MATSLKSRAARQVLYLYGITRQGEGVAAGVVGVDGSASVEAVPCAGLVSWVSRVDPRDFAENLASNMENLEWLAGISVRHQQVVAEIARAHDILPARFGTVFRTPASLASDVERHKATLTRDLSRISGCEEWGVKVFGLRVQRPAAKEVKSGRDYLQARAAAMRAEAPRDGGLEVRRLQRALDAVATETAPGSGVVSRGQRGLQWQGSVLVKRSERSQLQQLMARFSREWEGKRRLEVSGPWPPYSFVSRRGEKEGGPAQGASE